MSAEDDDLDGNDDDLDDDEYTRRMYPLEERPFSQVWRRAIGFKYYYRDFFHRDSLRPRSFRGWTPNTFETGPLGMSWVRRCSDRKESRLGFGK
jgi:hypothetical protein